MKKPHKVRSHKSSQRQAIVILGMHRSGTSALGGVLHHLGASAPKTLMPPTEANPKGYWESMRLMMANEELLAAAGSSWDDWRRFDFEKIDKTKLRQYNKEIKNIISDEFEDSPLFFLKDPRICRFLPFVLDILNEMNVRAAAFHVVRNPLEVAHSLNHRDGISLSKSLLIWLRHVLDAEFHSRNLPRSFLSYDELLINWKECLRSATRRTGVRFPSHAQESPLVNDFLTSTLRHEHFTYQEMQARPDFGPWAAEVYKIIRNISVRGEKPGLLGQLDALREKFEEGCAVFGESLIEVQTTAHELFVQTSRQAAAIEVLQSSEARNAEKAASFEKLYRNAVSQLEETQHERDEVREQLAAASVTNDDLQRSLENALGRLRSLRLSDFYKISQDSIRLKALLRYPLHSRKRKEFRELLTETAASSVPAILGVRRSTSAAAGWVGKVPVRIKREVQRFIRRRILRLPPAIAPSPDAAYQEWIERHDTLTTADRRAIRSHITRFVSKPLISVVMPVYNPDPGHLDTAIISLRNQLYPYWELCIADDASTNSEIRKIIAKHARVDSRIKPVFREENGHICAATNSALQVGSGEFIALMDHDDIIPEHALYWVAAELNQHPETDIVYTDSDLIDDLGTRSGPYFKSDFDLELMLGHNLVSHLGVYRRSLANELGGMRVGFEGSQDYDFFLRMLNKSSRSRIRHIPAILYHWRQSQRAPSYSAKSLERCVKAARKAVAEFLADRSIDADVFPARENLWHWQRVFYLSPSLPKVSVLIPTRDEGKMLRTCVQGIFENTDYPSLEVIIIDNDSRQPETFELYAELKKQKDLRVIPYPGEFNFAGMNNWAAAKSSGEILIFLNNDIEVVQSGWLREMVSRAMLPWVGAVGAKLCYPDGKIQHAGVVTGLGGDEILGRVAGHLYNAAPRDWPGRMGEALLAREVTAVTAACMAIRKELFERAGGFDETDLRVAYNDVDLCLRLRKLGYFNIITPFAELIHHESVSRGSDLDPAKRERFCHEISVMRSRWADVLDDDPYFSPNFSLDSPYQELSAPRLPRGKRPWLS